MTTHNPRTEEKHDVDTKASDQEGLGHHSTASMAAAPEPNESAVPSWATMYPRAESDADRLKEIRGRLRARQFMAQFSYDDMAAILRAAERRALERAYRAVNDIPAVAYEGLFGTSCSAHNAADIALKEAAKTIRALIETPEKTDE